MLVIMILGCRHEKQEVSIGPSLKEAYQDLFLIGTALNTAQIAGQDRASLEIVKKQFNAITAENIHKWEKIHPEEGVYQFGPADDFLAFGEKNRMVMIGHTLVWQNQTPAWVFEDANGQPVGRDELLKRLKDHIDTVVGRYRGKIHGWDVVNEAIDEQGNYRQNNTWYEIIGPDYIEYAFKWAHEADPGAELYYNDFNMWYEGKVESVIKLVRNLQSKNIPIHGIGLQGHWGLDYPPLDELEACLRAYSETGLNLMITEMEINVLPFPESADIGADITKNYELRKEYDPYAEGFPDSMQVILGNRYRELFDLFIQYKAHVSRVTLWGVHDGQSWTNYWPIRGRTNYPLLFDRKLKPKRAFYDLIHLVTEEE